MHQTHTGLPTTGYGWMDENRANLQDLVNDGYRYLASTTYTDTPETPDLPIVGGYDTSVHRNGTQRTPSVTYETRGGGAGLAVGLVLLAILGCTGSCLFMMLYDGTVQFVR